MKNRFLKIGTLLTFVLSLEVQALNLPFFSKVATDAGQEAVAAAPTGWRAFFAQFPRAGKWFAGYAAQGWEFAGKGVSAVHQRYYENPAAWEGFKPELFARDAAIGLGVVWLTKPYLTLRSIDSKITKSELANAQPKDFLFGSWNLNECKTPKQILERKNVQNELLNFVKKSHISILGDDGQMIDNQTITLVNIKSALEKEKQQLEQDLTKISYFTDAPKMIYQLVHERSEYPGTNLWYQQAAFHLDCTGYFKDKDSGNLDDFRDQLLNGKCNSYVKRALFMTPSMDYLPKSVWRCWRWRPGIYYNWASGLYWKVYVCYLRTLALLEVVNSSKAAHGEEQPVLEKLQQEVGVMIDKQNQAFNSDDNKTDQIAQLKLVKIVTAKAKENYQNQNETLRKLESIEQSLSTFQGHFLRNEVGNINNVLNNIKHIVDELVNAKEQ